MGGGARRAGSVSRWSVFCFQKTLPSVALAPVAKRRCAGDRLEGMPRSPRVAVNVIVTPAADSAHGRVETGAGAGVGAGADAVAGAGVGAGAGRGYALELTGVQGTALAPCCT